MSDLAIVALFCGGGGPLLVGEAGRQAGRQKEKGLGDGGESSRLYEEIIWREVVLGVCPG